MFENTTKNQHFISYTEQRLNALNPSAQKRNQRIYKFNVVERERPILALANPKGQKIKDTLSFEDLFSFDSSGHSGLRSNLEAQFQEYEGDLAAHSRGLLQKLQSGETHDIKNELLNLFAGKLLNFLRNPNSVTKVLNTIGVLADTEPTDPTLRLAFLRVQSGSRPRQAEICKAFGVEDITYLRWLKTLFLILMKPPGEPFNLFESTIKAMFESSYVQVHIYEYSTPDPHHVCLLSDRGFNVPIQGTAIVGFEFNLTSHAFARFAFVDPLHFMKKCARTDLAIRAAAAARATVDVTHFKNNLPALAKYNQLTAFQCASSVFAATSSPLLTA